ncbi:hypothetical protein [Nocardioides jishulii]|uniref:Uncharacterized protein n=1 Tax=Nocardioides jishulii TaxID=2575440 RepID=A0A4U2YMA8_9ACTN|nr:hypothetical protein [Nocardioides jishulii]QCX27579.1 hypothetical protein FCL41_08630 [Nocardioides jishulii]TKI62386.1 hypothetical protein FC770_08295 [Nocardioides jishulii]
MRRLRFTGHIAGVGSSSGLRAVVGRWDSSPFGAFSDVMVETAPGHRVLLAPRADVADFVASTYAFDEVRIEPVTVVDIEDGSWSVTAPSLDLAIGIGRRTLLGALLRVVPRTIATAPAWSRVTDPVSRHAVRGVRTRGSAGGGRLEVYGATDTRRVASLAGRFDGVDVGTLAPLDPPCRFGFSSAPRTPAVTELVTTVILPTDGG